ncbi:putative RNA-directed DNA polymerase [Tanacetum coccineum]
MKKYGYKQSNTDHTLFLSHRGDRVTCLIIYVDDMIITENDESAEFEMKDLGNLRYFLGIEVMRSQQGIFICQKKYILDLQAETRMIGCKPADTHMITNQKLFMKTKAKHADRDRYLKGTTGHGVLFKTNGHLNIQIFTDADWAGDKGNRRSTLGYLSLVGGNLVTWKSKKQKLISLSSVEAELRGIAKGLAEALWIRKLVSEIGFPPKESTRIMSDNKVAIQISENPVQHDRTKHVEVDRHFIKEKLEARIIKLPFVKSEDQLADILTKAVGMVIRHKCLNKLNFGDPTIQLEGEFRQELEAPTDPIKTEVLVVRKKIDSVNKEFKPLRQTCQKKEREYKEALDDFNNKNNEKVQLITRLMELVSESEKMRMNKLDELSKSIETIQ